jgi:Sec-independent protein translocase protein TatA
MEFLGIGPLELAFIILITVIVIGPRDIGKFARSAGQFLNRLYRSEEWKALNQASRNLRSLPNRLAREAALDELEKTRQEAEKAIQADSLPSEAPQGEKASGAGNASWGPRFPEPASGMQAWVAPSDNAPPSQEPTEATESPEETPPSDPPA